MNNITLSHVKKSYGNHPVLVDVNFTVPKNSFLLLNGASGTGKTTLLNIIAGLEKPTSGEVVFNNPKSLASVNQPKTQPHDEAAMSSLKTDLKIGFIHQGFYLEPQLSVLENITLPGIFANLPRKERLARAKELAESLKISDILPQKPSEISGGQAERVCLARALFLKPGLIIADEPTNNLDPENIKNILSLLNDVRKATGATLIVSSHDPVVRPYATKIITLENGVLHENL